jgi:hypothetical protein
MTVIGSYRKGMGRAHLNCDHSEIFGHRMVGTFNVRTPKSILRFYPVRANGEWQYWKIVINGIYAAWVARWRGSRMSPTLWEIISNEPLPIDLRQGRLLIEVLETETR